MSPPALGPLREAGRIAAAARAFGAGLIRPDALVRDVCEAVEEEISRRGGSLAFPVQSSRNQVAAHYCPSPDDATRYAVGDLAKLDIGVHIDGWVVDTALTVNVGERPENRRLVDAAAAALEAALSVIGAGVDIRRVSALIEATERSLGLRPVRNLCGHGVGRFAVHCPPPIPNVEELSRDTLAEGAVVAVEPFVTEGGGHVVEDGPPEVFRLKENPSTAVPGVDVEVLEAICGFRGLPFARRQLRSFLGRRLEETLAGLARHNRLAAYPPLVETSGRPVAQAEHTVYLGAEGAEVLTR
jgi:methionyl aminopeptidase